MKKLMIMSLIFVIVTPFTMAQRVAPAKVQAKMFGKLLAFYTNLGTKEFKIHVVGAPSVAKEFNKLVGTKIGNATLAGVSQGDGLPEAKADVIYLAKKHEAVSAFAKEKRVLSITGNPKLVENGATLGVGIAGGKPKILLNVNTSKEEGIIWNPAILRVAQKVN